MCIDLSAAISFTPDVLQKLGIDTTSPRWQALLDLNTSQGGGLKVLDNHQIINTISGSIISNDGFVPVLSDNSAPFPGQSQLQTELNIDSLPVQKDTMSGQNDFLTGQDGGSLPGRSAAHIGSHNTDIVGRKIDPITGQTINTITNTPVLNVPLIASTSTAGLETYDVSGDRYAFLASGNQTNDDFALFNFLAPPGGGPIPHIHAEGDETFYVLDGQVTFYTTDTGFVQADPGTLVFGPVFRPHAFRNNTAQPANVLSLGTSAGLDDLFRLTGIKVTDPSSPIAPFDLSILEKLGQITASRGGGIFIPGVDPVPNSPSLGNYKIIPPDKPGLPRLSGQSGEEYIPLMSRGETRDRYSMNFVTIPPGVTIPGFVNSEFGSSLYTLSGQLTVNLNGKESNIGPRTLVYAPSGTNKSYTNSGTTPVTALLFSTGKQEDPKNPVA